MEKNGSSIVALLGASLLGGLISFAFFDKSGSHVGSAVVASPIAAKATVTGCEQQITRVEGFNMVKPLLSAEPMCPAPRFDGMRDAINELVTRYRNDGLLNTASVYIREFKKGDWTVYNGNEMYDPGSMMKLPVLLTMLSLSEERPGLMEHTATCDASGSTGKQIYFESTHAIPGFTYTTRRLLELMVENSDNIATANVMRQMPPDRFVRTFTDLGLQAPDLASDHYRMTAQDYSVFMKALYNASLLGPLNSERAVDMMTRSDFKLGLLAGIPDSIQVAHKFGEAGDNDEKQLHETGLVYLPGDTYLITVMTKGNDMHKLPEVLSSISKLVYERMAAN